MSWQYPEPTHPCRVMPTRRCPDVYNDVCGDRPCARFESDDETPWLAELHDPECTCPREIRPLGRLYGVSMGKGWVRLDTDFRCPVHGGQDLRRAARRIARPGQPEGS